VRRALLPPPPPPPPPPRVWLCGFSIPALRMLGPPQAGPGRSGEGFPEPPRRLWESLPAPL